MSLLYGVLKDEETQQEFRITKKCVRIGRGENCDLSYDSSEYGHAEINVYTTFQVELLRAYKFFLCWSTESIFFF